ncbi:hypothetical protein JW721_04220 [Candidatus Micrarchaeota archaeon]|nr:hypothetical protein [Candidatus Micrarchaeota archaeon]
MRYNDPILKEAVMLAIGGFDGIPAARALARELLKGTPPIKINWSTVNKLCREDAEVGMKMEAKTQEWIAGLGKPEFLKAYSSVVWSNLSEDSKGMLRSRLDSILLEEIERYDGVPDGTNLGAILGIKNTTVHRRARANPEVKMKMEERAKNWLESLGEKEFLERCSVGAWTANLPEYAKEVVQKRYEDIILREIMRSGSAPNFVSLGNTIGIHGSTVMRHIESSEKLWFAYQQTRGLSRDQAVELAIQRGEKSEAISRAISERLRHLSASREIIAIGRCFGDLLEKLVSCVSLYPDIVSVAAKEGEINMSATHVPMNPFRRGEGQEIPGCGTVLVHGLHRLGGVGINVLFRKIRELYAEHPELSIITTHSKRYSLTEAFLEAMELNGFIFKESGSLRVESPDSETLESYGVAAEDVGRMSNKLTREINVGLFSMGKVKGRVLIPELEKALYDEGGSGITRQFEGMDVPEGIGRELRARFFPNLEVIAGDPFVVEVLHSGRACSLIGFDMHPKRARAVEVEVFPGAPAAEYRKIARLLATNMGFRRELGVVPNKLTAVRLKACRQAMKAIK